jgi:hypothetical protein
MLYMSAITTETLVNSTIDALAEYGGFGPISFHDIVASGATGTQVNETLFANMMTRIFANGITALSISTIFEGAIPAIFQDI